MSDEPKKRTRNPLFAATAKVAKCKRDLIKAFAAESRALDRLSNAEVDVRRASEARSVAADACDEAIDELHALAGGTRTRTEA